MKAPQDAMLDLIESAGKWNSFDGPAIAKALKDNPSLWRAVAIADLGGELRFNADGEVCGIDPKLTVLRGLTEGNLLYDIVRAIPSAENEELLEKLFRTLAPNSVRWLSFGDASTAFGRISADKFLESGYDPQRAVLEAWWD